MEYKQIYLILILSLVLLSGLVLADGLGLLSPTNSVLELNKETITNLASHNITGRVEVIERECPKGLINSRCFNIYSKGKSVTNVLLLNTNLKNDTIIYKELDSEVKRKLEIIAKSDLVNKIKYDVRTLNIEEKKA